MNYDIGLFYRPETFQDGTLSLWSNEYIASNVLKKHLNETIDSGSRKAITIESSSKWIIKNSSNAPDILDIGCGPGLYGNKLSGLVKTYDGIDISPYQISYAKEHDTSVGNTNYQVCDFRKWNPRKKYDTVLLL